MDNQEEPTLPNADENQAIDFSSQEYLKTIEPLLIVQDDWNTNKEEQLGTYIGYVDGQNDMVKILKHLLSLQLPFEETVKHITGLVTEREAFIEYADIYGPPGP